MDLAITPSFGKPLVFLSSQIRVFAHERKAIERLIKMKFGWDTYLFEAVATPHPPRPEYKAAIEQSQIFIGIYGTEYGWIDAQKGMTISGIHDEWQIATECRIERLAFVLSSNKSRDTRLQCLIDDEINICISSTPFSNESDLYDKVEKSLEKLNNEHFFAGAIGSDSIDIPDYSKQLTDRYESKHIIETSFFRNRLASIAENDKRLYIYGEPGIGKTVLLMLLAKKLNAIYISLRNRPMMYVLSYIANKVRTSVGQSLCTYTSIYDAMINCERLLFRNDVVLLIDDVDQNLDVANVLFGLETGKSKIVFSGRRYETIADAEIIQCPGFTRAESEKYVDLVSPDSDKVLKSEAVQRSNGNPLYLTYYAAASGEPPADTLDSYHKRIYDELPVALREILALLSLSEVILNIQEISTAASKYRAQQVTPIALQKELETASYLVSVDEGQVCILHPAFREHVNQRIVKDGLSTDIHGILSEVFDTPDAHYLRTYHKVCAGEVEKVYKDLPNAEMTSYLGGFVRIARKLFAADILHSRSVNNSFRLGYALYHAALIKKDLCGEVAGLRTIKLAEQAFSEAEETQWIRAVKLTASTFLVCLNKGNEAIETLQQLARDFKASGLVYFEAVARVNLSYVYNRLGKIDELENECLRAKELHESIDDLYGVAASLTNLNKVYIVRGDTEKILQTCRKIQEIAKKLASPRIEAAAMNGLTVYYRRKEMYEKAKEAAKRSISIAESIGSSELVAINQSNLGNVFRDQGIYSEAKECHMKALKIGERIKSVHTIAHAYGRLAEVSGDEEDGDAALDFGYKSIALWQEMGNQYEVASEQCKQADRMLRFVGFDWQIAMSIYRKAISNYMAVGLKREAYDSYQRLIDIELEHLRRFDAAETFNEALAMFANPIDIHYVSDLLEGLRSWNSRSLPYLNSQKIASETSKCLSPTLGKSALFNLIRNVACTIKHLHTGAKEAYELLIEQLVDQCKPKDALHPVTAIALALEQILVTTDVAWTTSIFERISAIDEALVFRHEHWLGDRWYILFNGPDAPIAQVDAGDNIGERVVAAIIALLLLRQKQSLEQLINKCGWQRISWKAQTLLENECRQHSIPVPDFQKDLPVVVSIPADDNVRDEIFLPILISDNYLSLSDHWKHPENRNALCVYLQIINEIVKHFTRSSISERRLSKFRRKTIIDTFDVKWGRSAG